MGLSVGGCDASLDVSVFFGSEALKSCLQYGQGDPQCFGGVVVDALVILDECWRELFHGDEELGGSEFDGAFFEDGGSCVEWHRTGFDVAQLMGEAYAAFSLIAGAVELDSVAGPSADASDSSEVHEVDFEVWVVGSEVVPRVEARHGCGV